MTGKLWRTRVRPLVLNCILFGLGVTTCLMFIQMSHNEIDSPVVYTNPQEYHSAQMQTQQEPPCNDKHYNSNSLNNNNNNKIGSSRIGSDSRINNVNSDPSYYEEFGVKAKSGVGGGRERLISTSADYHKVNKRVLKSSEPKKLNIDNVYNNDISNNHNNNNNLINNGDSSVNGGGESKEKSSGPIPTVWVVTPTFYRPEQKPELTRLAQALLPVRNFIHWIIVDDVGHGSDLSFKELEHFMKRFPLTYTILKSFPPKSTTKIVGKPRGVGGRRAAIDWLRKQYGDNISDNKGVVYFADDDNTYDSDVFRQMQYTKRVSMWPVGLVTELGVSSPIVKNGRVVGFYDGWNGLRKFPVDMAGFAINIQLFHDKPNANMPWVAGYEEDELLRSLGITMKDIQPLANNCTEILVWHTKAVRNGWPKRPKNLKPGLAASTNLNPLLNSLPQKSLAGPGANQNKADSGFSLLNFIFGGL